MSRARILLIAILVGGSASTAVSSFKHIEPPKTGFDRLQSTQRAWKMCNVRACADPTQQSIHLTWQADSFEAPQLWTTKTLPATPEQMQRYSNSQCSEAPVPLDCDVATGELRMVLEAQ